MNRSVRIYLAVVCAAGVSVHERFDGAALAQTQMTPTDGERSAATNIDRRLADAQLEAALANIRLELLLGQRAIQDRRYEVAAHHAVRAQEAMRNVPANIDMTEQSLIADGILARAQREGVNVDPGRFEQGIRDAAAISRAYTGADKPDIDTRGDEALIRKRTLRQIPDSFGYRPGQAVFDVPGILARDEQRTVYQQALREAYKDDEVRLLVEADEARVAPDGWVQYPDDWKEKAVRRDREHPGGMIARTPAWKDDQGREWYIAVYDVHDLIYVVPDFAPALTGNPLDDNERQLNLNYLRFYGWGFGRYPDDLAATIPLLRYFGGSGIDDIVFRGPKYSAERQQQIAQLIEAFTGDFGSGQPRIVPVPPADLP